MNRTIEKMLSHRSIRTYQDKPVNDEYLNLIIKSIQAAPNWVNIQLVSIIAIKDKKRRERFSELCGHQKHIAEAPVFLIFCADYYRASLACKMKNQSIDKIFKDDIDPVIVGANEVGIALGTAVIAAESLGLGTVPIGDIRKNALQVIKELELPKYVIPLLGLCIGYLAQDPGVKPRLPQKVIFFEETYNTDLEYSLQEFDKVYATYLKERPWNNRVGDWTGLVADFYRRPHHYEETAEMLQKQGLVISQNSTNLSLNSSKTDK